MENLSEQQQASIAKMSDARLRMKLEQAGYDAGLVAQWERRDLLAAWTRVVAAEFHQAAAEACEFSGIENVEDGEHYEAADVVVDRERLRWSLEERRLMLEERRLEEQRLQREQEERRWKREFELKERELDLKRITAEREEAQKDNIAMKLKIWGEASKNA